MSGGLTVLAMTFCIVIALGAVLAYGLARVALDLRERALSESQSYYVRHFAAVSKLIEDDAVSDRLASAVMLVSEHLAHAENAVHMLDLITDRPRSRDPRMRSLADEVSHLRKRRPDLGKALDEVAFAGILGGSFRHVVDLTSPLRAFREKRRARRVEGRPPRSFTPQVFAEVDDLCHAA